MRELLFVVICLLASTASFSPQCRRNHPAIRSYVVDKHPIPHTKPSRSRTFPSFVNVRKSSSLLSTSSSSDPPNEPRSSSSTSPTNSPTPSSSTPSSLPVNSRSSSIWSFDSLFPKPVFFDEGNVTLPSPTSGSTNLPLQEKPVSTLPNSTATITNIQKVMPKMFDWRGGNEQTSYVVSSSSPSRSRLGPLKVNLDKLTYLGRKSLQRGKVDEAQEFYSEATALDKSDGRAWLGLSRCYAKRRNFKEAEKYLEIGLQHCDDNEYLLQSMGALKERIGSLSEAERWYAKALRVMPSHAASWISLAQLRTRKLGQGVGIGRMCFVNAEYEMRAVGKNSSHLYSAWGGMEYKQGGDVETARDLFRKSLELDPRSSATWLQLGVMEGDNGNFKAAEECFETCLEYDPKNSRILQAYAILETKNSKGGKASQRKAIELFEQALKYNKRDAGVLQAYALYVAKLGDLESARNLLVKGTKANPRHAPVWQAWGVLETRCGDPDEARRVFQEGIWACAQAGGGQSGGRRCANLWQAWGVMESSVGDFSAARRCFNRALDADRRNVAAVTAWALMEQEVGSGKKDARMIFERGLKQFSSPPSEIKIALWNSYELMERNSGDLKAAAQIEERKMSDTMVDETFKQVAAASFPPLPGAKIVREQEQSYDDLAMIAEKARKQPDEEVMRWKRRKDATLKEGQIWMSEDGFVEGKMPQKKMAKANSVKGLKKKVKGTSSIGILVNKKIVNNNNDNKNNNKNNNNE